MIAITPRVFDTMQAYGFATTIPDNRRAPGSFSAVLFDPGEDRVYFPPFRLENGLLVEVGDALHRIDFEELVAQGYATKLPGGPARSDGCYYFPPGSMEPEYTSLTHASRMLTEFANEKADLGDSLLRAGRHAEALDAYELAAATSQSPDHFARVLLLPLSTRWEQRYREALAQVAVLDPPERHIDRVKAQMVTEIPSMRANPSSARAKRRAPGARRPGREAPGHLPPFVGPRARRRIENPGSSRGVA